MTAHLDRVTLSVFGVLFLLITVAGFIAAQWRPALDIDHIDQWGLGGRQFGTWVIWFLIGGDFYTAYAMIAVPAVVHIRGAYGLFAIPYGILVYPIVFLLMPMIWTEARRAGHVTAGDLVFEQYKSRLLELAVAITGVLATMPYIAVQLVGMGVVMKALGLPEEPAMIVAFTVLALYTYSSGLRAPALIAFVKDLMIYILVLALVGALVFKLGGFTPAFSAAEKVFSAQGAAAGAGILLRPSDFVPYATLTLGSALAAFMYPHTMTAVLAAKSADTVRRNAVLLPIYTGLVALIALLGYMGHAVGINLVPAQANSVVPMLVQKTFPSWFVGFAFTALVVGALVPAAVMSIGSANLFARNFWRAYIDPTATPEEEAKIAKLVSLLVKLGALLFVLFLPVKFAINLQLLGGMWILQIFPAVVFGLFTHWFRGMGLLAGWAIGFFGGTAIIIADNLSPLHAIAPGYSVYVGLLALGANIATSVVVSALMNAAARSPLAA